MNYTKFYANVTPNNLATGSLLGVEVTGISALVDTDKYWNSGTLSWGITPRSSGRATVTFLNKSNNTIIGTREILVRSNELALPTYTLTASASTVNKGSAMTFNLSTTDVLPGTNVPFTITGVAANKLTPNSLTGNFNIGSDGKATVTITHQIDGVTEPDKTLTLSLNNNLGSRSVTIRGS